MRTHLVCCNYWLWIVLLGGSDGEANDARQLLRGSRSRRSLLYPNPGNSETKVQVLFGLGLPMEEELAMTLGYVIKCNYNLPYNTSQLTGIVGERQQQQLSQGGSSRWGLYRILETALGKSCLLRAVCEAAEVPLTATPSHALLGQLLQLTLTPSATREDYELYADREYHAAEAKGRSGDCSPFYDDCTYSPLDYFSRLVSLPDFESVHRHTNANKNYFAT